MDDSGWNKKWAIEYYFLEFEKIINKFPSARIREEDDEEFSSGRLKLEIANAALSTIEEAFERALPIIDEIISKVENSLSGFNNILNIIEAWNVNKDNKDEEFWQKLFTNYPEIISQSFSYPIVFFQDKAYLGGKSIRNRDGRVIDYVFKNNLTNNIALIEIKTPQTSLIGSQYRNTFSMSQELTGSINQLLLYKDTVFKEFYSIRYNTNNHFQVFNPKCLLIVGSFESLNKEEKEAFELFRNDFKTIDILTFDELFDKIYILLKMLQ